MSASPDSPDANSTELMKGQAEQGAGARQLPQYRDEYVPIARELAQLGASDEHLQRAFNINGSTLSDWRVGHADFDEACRAGTKALGANLYRRAMGYDSEERKVVVSKQGPIVLQEVRHIPADPRAAPCGSNDARRR
jgi:hypothetical protein